MGFDRIIALDLGKFNSVCCTTDVATQQHRFGSIATTPQAMHDFLVARIAAGDAPPRTLVVFESCDVAGSLHDLASALEKCMRGMTSINPLCSVRTRSSE